MVGATATCSCFGWCDTRQVEAFLASLPDVRSTDSPWYSLVTDAYHTSLKLPVRLAKFGVFKLPRSDLYDGAFDVTCPLSPRASCASSIGVASCRRWQTEDARPFRLSLSRRRDGALPLAPWPWNRSLRLAHGTQTVEHHVQLSRTFRFKLEWVHAWGDSAHLPARIMLWRSANHPVAAANHSWIEAFRVRHPSQPEGVDGYGCWFYPLLSPFSRGAGTFVNVGRTLVFAGRYSAAAFFRRRYSAAAPAEPGDGASDAPRRRKASPNFFVTFRGKHIYGDKDRLWAIVAHLEGYDSVQILHGPFGMPELLISRSHCLTQRRRLLTCPPSELDLRTGEDATQACHCSEGQNVFNCDRSHARL